MSTDDSISEDVSSSGALSHCPDRDGGKESETSLLSSEGTSASGLAVSEDRHTTSQTTGGTVESRHVDITPACNKIRSLCLTTDDAFEQGKTLPFINPSSLETLRALVQEIQSSGETDPEIWKDCEDRWLHLFQLVEKQYQEQILAQQEQYQCQIQLIQDEIKALVQLQNRQPHSELSLTPVTKTSTNTKDDVLPPVSIESPAAPARIPLSSPSPPLQRPETAGHPVEERATTGLSSGYGTLTAWGTGPEPAASPWEDETGSRVREKDRWPSNIREDKEIAVTGGRRDISNERAYGAEEPNPLIHQQRTSGTSQPLTSWAQRQKRSARKSKPSTQILECPDQPSSFREPVKSKPVASSDSQDQQRPAEPSGSFPLRRSDSLMSEASGLTYWRLTESELYHPLPDSFDSGAYLLLQEASTSLTPSQESRPSLREIYLNKPRPDGKRSDWECPFATSPSSPQVLTLDPAANQRQSDRTSGFTSPSHFSSPSFATQPQLYPCGTPVTPDSMAECSPNPGDADGNSDSSSLSAFPSKMQGMWGNPTQAVRSTSQEKILSSCRASSQRHGASEEEEGSRTRSSTLRPCSASGATPAAGPRVERAASIEDPVVFSLLRQNLREKHSRHVADLKAYYESEIQILRDKLKLKDLPRDLEKTNQVLTKRCKQLEKALAEATNRIQELEATNSVLHKQLAEWPERYAVAGAAVKSLQQQLEESKRSGKDKDAMAARLKSHVRRLEESAQKACREAEEKEARREREYEMLQELPGEYNSLVKEHEGLKDILASTEDKLFDANGQLSELKRAILKLESQVKQLEHENQARARYVSHGNRQPSGAGLFHHPDLLLSPSKCKAEPDVTCRRLMCPPPDQINGGRKSPFKLNQSIIFKKSQNRLSDQSSGGGGSADASPAAGSRRCASPPECEQSLPRREEHSGGPGAAARTLTPMMRALIELEEIRATESRAPWVNSQRTRVGFVEQKHKEAMPLRADREVGSPGGGGGGGGSRAEPGGAKSLGGAETAAGWLRAQRSLSPEGHRSSSLPPPAHKTPPSTPTKRETLLGPLSAKSSPKRCPTENYSTAFGCRMPRGEHLLNRFVGQVDQRRQSSHGSSPRRRLRWTSADGGTDVQQPEENSQQAWEEDMRDPYEDSSPLLLDRLHSLAEAEKLFDELTQEKLQIEAALSRMPGAGGRVSRQTRLDQVALEDRLERVNRELGSIRMTLKRFHVLRSSSNI
ncbi:M-phase phosphoprotein 9 [Brachionichthys hirsutus]|uniref:M-phase phosphoprotein 9 n=1 Tax=Brachionichthys hirsutus TaxID=412623 RepID=UPI003605131E